MSINQVVDCSTGIITTEPVAPPSLADQKAHKKLAIKAEQAARFRAGWTHAFGSAGTHTLDLRNADDKANWTLLLLKTQAMIAAGQGGDLVQLRTQANDTIEISAFDAQLAMVVFLKWGEDMLSRKWALDELVDAAADQATLDAVDTAAGWPA